jgi:hypothetical protein
MSAPANNQALQFRFVSNVAKEIAVSNVTIDVLKKAGTLNVVPTRLQFIKNAFFSLGEEFKSEGRYIKASLIDAWDIIKHPLSDGKVFKQFVFNSH